MKRVSLLLLIGLTLACDQAITPEAQLLGTWNWLGSSGGLDGRIETPSSTGNDIYIKISEKNFSRYVNGMLENEWSYIIKKGPSIRTANDTYLIVFKSGRSQTFSLISDTLMLYDECYDCLQSIYLKQ